MVEESSHARHDTGRSVGGSYDAAMAAFRVLICADDWHDRLVAAGATITAPPADRPWGHRTTSVVVPGLDLHVTLFHELAPTAPEVA
jgi:uncharacterized glyoxalase superfamily protein PhnB